MKTILNAINAEVNVLLPVLTEAVKISNFDVGADMKIAQGTFLKHDEPIDKDRFIRISLSTFKCQISLNKTDEYGFRVTGGLVNITLDEFLLGGSFLKTIALSLILSNISEGQLVNTLVFRIHAGLDVKIGNYITDRHFTLVAMVRIFDFKLRDTEVKVNPYLRGVELMEFIHKYTSMILESVDVRQSREHGIDVEGACMLATKAIYLQIMILRRYSAGV